MVQAPSKTTVVSDGQDINDESVSQKCCGNCDWLVTSDWHLEVIPGSGYCTVHCQNRRFWMGEDCPKWTPWPEF